MLRNPADQHHTERAIDPSAYVYGMPLPAPLAFIVFVTASTETLPARPCAKCPLATIAKSDALAIVDEEHDAAEHVFAALHRNTKD